MKLLCTKCNDKKDEKLFPTAKANIKRNGKSSWCKKCSATSTRKWSKTRKKHIAKTSRNRHLKRKFGITSDTFEQLLKKQNNKCYICDCSVDSLRVKQKNFCVDHDHITGKIRKLLCDHCNLILGNADDDISLLQKCINYLEKHNGKV